MVGNKKEEGRRSKEANKVLVKEYNNLDAVDTPFTNQDQGLYSPRRRPTPISVSHLKKHPSYQSAANKQLERKRTWVALNLIPTAPESLKNKLGIVGDIAGGVAIQPIADKDVLA